MKEKKTVYQFTIAAEIFDVDLPAKIENELANMVSALSPEIYYSIDVTFDRSVYSKPEFFRFPLEPQNILSPKDDRTEAERKREIYDSILNQQIINIVKQVELLGVKISDAGIIGNDLADAQRVQIEIKEHYTKEELPERYLKTFCIMPEHPMLNKELINAFARIVLDQMKKEKLFEFEKASHIPNMIPASDLFHILAQALLCDDERISELELINLAEKLRNEAAIKSEWPLEVESGKRAQPIQHHLAADFQIDCPQYLLFHAYTGGHWTLKKIDNLKTAQYIITKKGYNQKGTSFIVVLDNLKVLPFTLLEETSDGLVAIDRENAQGKKKLLLSWNK